MMLHPLRNSATRLSNVDPDSVQPNAVDLRVAKVYKFGSEERNRFSLTENLRVHADRWPVDKMPLEGWGLPTLGWYLKPGFYIIEMSNRIDVAPDEAGWVISRSSLVRNGIYLVSGLYDSGYSGSMTCGMHVTAVPFLLEDNARVGQYLSFKAESIKQYDGVYQEKPRPEAPAHEEKKIATW